MASSIDPIDWLVIAIYLIALLGFAYYLSRGQHNREDYYVGGRKIGSWPIAISILATQCSTNSILGAPAFVAFAAGGGLLWLQYELAVPLAMLVIILVLVPVFRALKLVSVYGFLEQRFDLRTRLLLSGLFQFVRAFATAVTVYSIALVIELITGLSFFWSVVLLGLFTVVYDVMGGIKGVIYSDVAQMIILVAMLLIVFVSLVADAGGLSAMLQTVPSERLQTLRFDKHGFGDGHTFAFWPMLFGGLFLYVSYYGCDQSQAQRVLSSDSQQGSVKALFYNGLLRFPLVALYCFVGVGIAAYAINNSEFIGSLPANGEQTNYNLAVPVYMIQQLPVGLVGMALVALFAAAMSSLDSVLNSLSATTMEDFIFRFRQKKWSLKRELWVSRLITATWGLITLTMAFFVGDIASTVLEAINKIGSLANGPVLAVFMLGVLTRIVSANAVITGMLAGFLFNAYCWIELPNLSWLWWNVTGFIVTVIVALLFTLAQRTTKQAAFSPLSQKLDLQSNARYVRTISFTLLIWFALMFSALLYQST
ncbi:MAG: sodium:solute symporter [Aliiglaciecola sp.]